MVGNAAYEHAAPLANPKNDAEDMAAVLEGLGFAVERAMNLDYRAFTERVLRFSKRTKGAEAALFYYAGHGLQVSGVNYLLPVDVALEDEMQLRFQTVDLAAVLQGMRSSANLVFLDACRDNPFVRSVARSMGTRSFAVGRGLAPVENNAYGGAFIAFATAAGEVASDGDGRNSPFTAALKQHIGSPGLEINQVLNRVRRELAGIEQEPWATSSLVDDFYFSARPSAALPVPPFNAPTAPRVDPAEELWNQIRASNNSGQFELFMRAFPDSPLVHSARARLDELQGQPFTVVVDPAGARVRILNIEPPYRAGMKLPAGEYRVEASASDYEKEVEVVSHGSSPTTHRMALRKAGLKPGQRFRDCPECPELVVVPSGSFLMGSPSHEEGREGDEGPVHQVRIGEPFAVGVYEVTFAEWDACVAGGGCGGYRPDDEGWGRGHRPVVNVSWGDAESYVSWLSLRTGKRYRLPSESEWEYVARAGTTGPFHTGSTISTDQANYDGNYVYGSGRKGVYRKRTVPVGSFGANAFGLHDVHGNVFEWVQDCWNGSYAGAPSDGSAWESGNCSYRVLRGGSWIYFPWLLRSALRNWLNSGIRSDFIGFRVARTLAP